MDDDAREYLRHLMKQPGYIPGTVSAVIFVMNVILTWQWIVGWIKWKFTKKRDAAEEFTDALRRHHEWTEP